ncbi:unnamed protein product, partial [Porites lobata]
GIQGAPGVGFSLTTNGNYDINGKRLTNVGAPNSNTDAATKKYVDDNSSGSPTTTRLTVDSNIDMKDQFRILNLKHPDDADEPATKQYADSKFLDRNGSRTMIGNLSMNNNKIIKVGTPTANDDVATKKYVDDKSSGSLTDGSYPMKGNLNMDNKQILNLPAPTGPKQPTPLAFTDLKYVARDGSSTMTNNLNMDNKKIINLRTPTSDTDATTKKYVDDSIPDTSSFVKKDGSITMTDNLNLGNKKIIGLATPTSNTDAANKKYVDDNTAAPDLSDYFEKDGTVTMTGNLNVGNNKIINLSKPTQDNEAVNKNYADKLFCYKRIGDLTPNKGNFHDYNHKVIFMGINKNSQGGYKYKMGINFYRLTANVDYTLCLEILNTDYQLWYKSQISVDKGTSTGLSIGNVSVRKLSHRYSDSKGQTQFMYYHRIIVNFRKQFLGVYLITYGIVGTFSNIDPDKVYDYHTAFDIKPTQVVYNVDINANNKKILNVNLDRNNNNSVATVGM